MLLDFINYTSERGFIQDPDYPEVWHIEAHDLTRLEYCPYPHCGGNLTSREEAEQLHKIHDYDTRTKNVILISLYRKNYRCTKCRRSCTANEKLNALSRTDAFDRYIALEAIKGSSRGIRLKSNGKRIWSYDVLGHRYGYGKDTISKIVRTRAPALTPLLIPFHGYEIFFIHSFEYKFKKRYYLLACDIAGNAMLLGVFGYQNAIEEIRTYFELHKDFIKTFEEPFVTTSYDMELVEVLQQIFGNDAVVIRFKSMDDRMTQIRNSFADMHPRDRDTSVALINRLEAFLKKKETGSELLNNWWKLCQEEDAASNSTDIVHKILPLWKELSSNFIIFLKTYQTEKLKLPDLNATISAINKQISNFSQNGPDFTVLAARMMLFSKEQILDLMGDVFIYTSDIFTSGKKPEDCVREKMNSDGQLDVHAFYELLGVAFNPEDINAMMIDSFWKHYEDEPKEEESEYRELDLFMEENRELFTEYNDISYDSLYFEEVNKEYLFNEEEEP